MRIYKLKASELLQLVPTWLGNLLLFGLLLLIVIFYSFWQVRLAQKTFLFHAREHARILSEVIQKNVQSINLSQETIEENVTLLLNNIAKYIDYLDSEKPFSIDELSDFAGKMGIDGIRIVDNTGNYIEGPEGFLKDQTTSCHTINNKTRNVSNSKQFIITAKRKGASGCVIVAMTSNGIETIMNRKIELNSLLDSLSDISGILYVKLEKPANKGTQDIVKSQVTLINDNKIAEARLLLDQEVLVVGLETKHILLRVKQLWNELFVFCGIVAFISALFSWILNLYQLSHLEQVRNFERQLAKEHEDAALGRASATITHEIRNPLNAIHMGLQRLQIESEELTEEHRDIISTILKAVKRTNGIVTNLKRYTTPLKPKNQRINFPDILQNILALYKPQCEALNISVTLDVKSNDAITGDSDLIEELVENLIKNAIEAQPKGGYLKINTRRQNSELALSIQNGGFHLSESEAERILEPYFTTKARGSGLGLAISKHIINAHNGRIEITMPSAGNIRISAYFPLIIK